MAYLLLVVGFVMLIFGANYLVDGASSIAKKFGISDLIIGLTVVAFGTSAPELVVNLTAGFSGNADLAISNIIGSNISNILLILGTTALVFPLKIDKQIAKLEIPFYLIVITLFLLLMSDKYFGFKEEDIFDLRDSLILVEIFICYMYYTFKKASQVPQIETEESIEAKKGKCFIPVLFIFGGLAGLIFGGNLIVNNAVLIAKGWGLSNNIIGVTVVAVGTSLPELASSLAAAMKKNTDLAVGAIIGSNIFNTLWILGVTGIFTPLKGYDSLHIDILFNIFITILLIFFVLVPSKYILSRIEGGILVTCYFSYIGYLVFTL